MPTLSQLILDTAQRMQTVTVDVRSIYGTVCISDDKKEQEDIFLQGDDGSAFCSELNRLWNETGDLDKQTIALYLAYPYVQNIWS